MSESTVLSSSELSPLELRGAVLLDANILLRLANEDDPLFHAAQNAVESLAAADIPLILAPQTLYEFWAVATRPASARGGLNRTAAQAEAEIARYAESFDTVSETADVLGHWRRLCVKHETRGMAAHDARYVALMAAHGIGRILTFNAGDFRRYESADAEGIEVIDPTNFDAAQWI
jgi:predicted nucleic acid-binding protein